MRPGLVVVASGVGLAVLFGSAGFSTAGPSRDGVGARVASSGATVPSATAAKKKKCKSKGCRILNVGQGSSGLATCGPPQLLDQRTTPGSDVLRLDVSRFDYFYNAVPGDLLVAAVATEGAAITPPSGWQAVPRGDVSNGTGQRLQLFYSIPVPLSKQGTRTFGPERNRFVASVPERLTGSLIGVAGVDQADPVDVAAGAPGATPSAQVVAPSITPDSASTRLLFVGAAGPAPKWTAPAGMRLVRDGFEENHASGGTTVAYEWWRTATATGTRTATISSSAASIGALIALKVPRPTTCPKLLVRNPRHGKAFQFAASAEGVVSVRLKCAWSRRCVGVFGLLSPTPVAAGDVSIPAGRTRTVHIDLCNPSSRGCPLHGSRGKVPLSVGSLVAAPNGQLVVATNAYGVLKLP